MKRYSVLLVLSLLLTTGCIGLVFNGTSEEVTFNSSPAGADVLIDGVFAGVTPFSLELARSESHIAEIKMAGYEDATFQIKRAASGIIIVADVFVTGGLGLIIDFATGSLYDLSPTEIVTSMDNISLLGNIVNVSMVPVSGGSNLGD